MLFETSNILFNDTPGICFFHSFQHADYHEVVINSIFSHLKLVFSLKFGLFWRSMEGQFFQSILVGFNSYCILMDTSPSMYLLPFPHMSCHLWKDFQQEKRYSWMWIPVLEWKLFAIRLAILWRWIDPMGIDWHYSWLQYIAYSSYSGLTGICSASN